MGEDDGTIPILTVTICGGGNAGHTAAGFIGAKKETRVNILTRRPSEWQQRIEVDTSFSSWASKGHIVGVINKISDNPQIVIPDADIIIIASPANTHKSILFKIKPYIKKNVFLGTLYGQGGFDWCADFVFKEDLSILGVLFGFQNIPWLCRVRTYGEQVILMGPKKILRVACYPPHRMVEMCKVAEYLFDIPTSTVQNFLALTLTPSNQIIHPARYYSIFRNWNGKTPVTDDEIQWSLYTEMDDCATFWLSKLDGELQSIKNSLMNLYPDLDLRDVLPVLERIHQQYGDDIKNKTNLQTSVASNLAYRGCTTPVLPVVGGFIPAVNSRLFLEDIPFGLCVLKNIAEMINIETPSIDFMIEWHQQFMGKEYVKNGKLCKDILAETGCPASYDIDTADKLVKFSLSLHWKVDMDLGTTDVVSETIHRIIQFSDVENCVEI